MQIVLGTPEYALYDQLAGSPPKGQPIIGKGEAAVLALAKVYEGIIASNNLKDIGRCIEKYKLAHVTTGDILIKALNHGLIDEGAGNKIWKEMLLRRRLLPTGSFTEYIASMQ